MYFFYSLQEIAKLAISYLDFFESYCANKISHPPINDDLGILFYLTVPMSFSSLNVKYFAC